MNLFLDADLNTKQALLDSLGVATCLAEKQGDDIVLVAMNDRYREFYGFTIELVEPIAQRMRNNANRCLEGRFPLQTENQMPQADGSERWSRNTLSPIVRNGMASSLLVTVVDITEVVTTQRKIESNLTRLIGRYVHVCRDCSRIQDEDGVWLMPETFMAKRGQANFSHGICPTCKSGFS
ncbi:MAG: PAS domain S-box protein [Arenibacter algicola]|nr:PAS domain S-box protein [Arenibacter algicola]